MIKYVTFESHDEYGEHITPVDRVTNTRSKIASGGYSPELMKVILSLKRKPELYYVVINALGSYEVWGVNGNGDAFPKSGLEHVSLRTDMNTPNDYGYKTFEYYSKLFKHHVNRSDSPSYGEVIFSHWNPTMQRVELVVGIDKFKGKDMIDDMEKNIPIAVSMGCRVKYDRCSICDHKAPTRKQYCKHTKTHLGKIIDKETAEKWSKELGKTILPGTKVFVYNDMPKFFDISKVNIGADRTAHILGKAANQGHVYSSADMADAYGVNDELFDKIAQVKKQGDIDKRVGALGPDDIDGKVAPIKAESVVLKALKEKVNRSIEQEPEIDKSILDRTSSVFPLSQILSSMLSMGIHPKPREFQRIVLVNAGRKDVADELDSKNIVFDNKSSVKPEFISDDAPNELIMKMLQGYAASRSCMPHFLEPRIKIVMVKTASEQPLFKETIPSNVVGGLAALGSIAALYAGLSMKAKGLTPKQIHTNIENSGILKNLVAGGAMTLLLSKIGTSNNAAANIPISEYEGMLQDTDFSGIPKTAKLNVPNALGYGMLASGIALPASYIANVYNQRSMYTTGRQAFPGAGTPWQAAVPLAGAGTVGGMALSEKAKKYLKTALKVK
jgi:hypothetical protein